MKYGFYRFKNGKAVLEYRLLGSKIHFRNGSSMLSCQMGPISEIFNKTTKSAIKP
jgi:hypothetical protein